MLMATCTLVVGADAVTKSETVAGYWALILKVICDEKTGDMVWDLC